MMNSLDNFRKRMQQMETEGKSNKWVSHELKFHIDSSNAFSQFEKQQKVKDYDVKDDEFEITD